MPRRFVECRTLLYVALICLSLAAYARPAGAQDVPRIRRVRSDSPLIAAAIAQGVERSTTFRRLVEVIDTTDGLVYVLQGECGQGVRACLHMSVELSGPNRVLRILVNPRRAPGCELVESIGHELQHALEALLNPRIRTADGLSSFFRQIGPEGPRRFETEDAIRAGLAVGKEACKGWTDRG
jgi:hypothetical protein